MTLEPFLSAATSVQVHLVAAVISLLIGPLALYRQRRDSLHKMLGYMWVTAMAVVALSSFAIPSYFTPIGIGPLHLFAVVTLWSLWTGVKHAIQKNTAGHEAVFRGLFSNGLIIAGAFTVLPGRTLNRMLFGEPSQLGWLVFAGVLGLVTFRLVLPRVRSRVQA